jgi:hypothetical protein
MELTAHCVRRGKWWVVDVPEIRGLFTQVKRLDQVEEWILDAASMLDDQPAEGFTVTVVPDFGEEVAAKVTSAKQAREKLRQMETEAAEASKNAAAALANEGLTVREIGKVLNLSHQRAAQLVNAA